MKAIKRWPVINLKQRASKKWLHLRTASTIAAESVTLEASVSTTNCSFSSMNPRETSANSDFRSLNNVSIRAGSGFKDPLLI